MYTMWLLGGMSLGAGLMYLLDPEKGRERRDLVREHVVDYGHQTADLVDNTTRTLGRQAQAAFAQTSLPFRHHGGLAERRHTPAEGMHMPLSLYLLGFVGLGVGLGYLFEPQRGAQRRARLGETIRAYWRPSTPRHAPQQELRRAWRFFQGHETHRVDAHTRKPARAMAWYAEPADYESPLLYSEPFVTREEAEAWARTEEQRQLQEHIEV